MIWYIFGQSVNFFQDEEDEDNPDKKKKKKNIVPVSDPSMFRQPIKKEDDIEEAGVWQEPYRKLDSTPVDKTPLLPVRIIDFGANFG